MRSNIRSTFALALLGGLAFVPAARAITLPQQTAIPVMFTHTLKAGKVKAGDGVTAKTMQVVMLPGGEQIPKGTLVTGHIVDARPFQFDDTDYAVQQPSYLAIHIDQLMVNGVAVPVTVSVRALADAASAEEALTPHRTDELDYLGTMELIGGGHYSPLEKRITDGTDDAEDTVGYHRKQGVFARLLPGGVGCDSTQTEQSVAIFSPQACGLYGFVRDRLAANSNSTFRLESTYQTVTMYAGTAALLEVR